jgi:hypothetical protein
MLSWRNANRVTPSCGGGFVLPCFTTPRSASRDCGCSVRLLRRIVFLSALLVLPLFAQQKPTAKPSAAHRANELTLAGLHPGKDSSDKAVRLYGRSDKESNADQLWWHNGCLGQALVIDVDQQKKIQVLRLTTSFLVGDCEGNGPSPWKTGRGLRVKSSTGDLLALYGPPDSKSPSTRDGQPLELWYYAFDWAGPDVPQVMEVLCTREQDGKPGRVVEITLAAPSL